MNQGLKQAGGTVDIDCEDCADRIAATRGSQHEKQPQQAGRMTAIDARCSQVNAASSEAEAAAAQSVTTIQPRHGWQRLDLPDLWRYRDLLWFLMLRDVQVRYKQTVLGAAWAIIQPVAMMAVASIFFGRLLGVAAKVSVPYPIFFFSGMLAWTFFSGAVGAASMSLVNNAAMLRKIYFPRLIVPFASIGVPAIDLLVSALVLVAMMVWYDVPVTWQLVLLPALSITMLAAALGVGLLLAALNVAYRDFRYVVPFMLQIWFFVTPVIFPVTIVPPQWQWLLQLNPMGGTIEAFRACILGTEIDYGAWAISTLASLVLLALGILYFNRTERRFADVV